MQLFEKLKGYIEEFKYPLFKDSALPHRYFKKLYEELDGLMFYAMLRHFKPKRVIEIGSGHSTKLACDAICKNKNNGNITCIEPYHSSILEQLPITLIKKRVEECPLQLFDQLEKNDLLFIDSSHVIKPYGDVLYEYLNILPRLKPGVMVHIHDIFLPYDYPKEWIEKERRPYTKQWFLAALLHNNKDWNILFSCFYFFKTYQDLIQKSLAPFNLHSHASSLPSSFWIEKK
ncbi:MAG: hypothetical protein K940chlam8_00233 [Chlamydiae bacterium]|nr:hypothetical protein [Chlamydiota bacterium]